MLSVGRSRRSAIGVPSTKVLMIDTFKALEIRQDLKAPSPSERESFLRGMDDAEVVSAVLHGPADWYASDASPPSSD
jgi:hypothetical protein